MKLLKYIVNIVVWSLLTLYVMVMLFTHIPACQAFLGEKVAQAIGEKLGTKVSIGRVDLGFLNRVIIDDVLIYDQQQQMMLSAARLSARVDILPLTQGRISISSAQLFGANARTYQKDSLSKPNFQFVLDSLASKDTTSHTPLDLHINSLILRNSSVRYDQMDAPQTPGAFNPKHLFFSKISAYVTLKTLTDDSLDVNIRRLALIEQAGLDINRLSMRLHAGRTGASLRDFRLEMPSTQVQIDTIDVAYQFSGDTLNMATLSYHGSINNTYVTPSDLKCFHTPLKNFQKAIHLETAFQGTGSKLTVPQIHLYTEAKDISLLAHGWIDHSTSLPSWEAKVDELKLSESIIDFLQKNISGIPEQVKHIGDLQLNGGMGGSSDGGIHANSNLMTGIGQVNINLMMTGDKKIQGTIDTQDMSLRQLLDDEHFGNLTANVKLDGCLTPQHPSINAQGIINEFTYNNYPYSHIGINGSYSDKGISGFLNIEDPNLMAQIEGAVDNLTKNKDTRKIDIHGTISHLNPQNLKLTDRWNNAVFAAEIDADFTAKTLNDAQGTLQISNFSMTNENTAYHLDNLLITSGFRDQLHYVTLDSDFAKAELRGDFEYSTLAQSLTNFIGSALPTLPGLSPVSDKTHNNFALRVEVTKSDWLQQLLGIDLHFSKPFTLNARINDPSHMVNLESQIHDITYNGAKYTDGTLLVAAPTDTIRGYLAINKLMDNGQTLNIGLRADAANNLLNTAITWNNGYDKGKFSGNLNLTTSLYRNLQDQSEAHIRIQPSNIILNDSTWNVEPSDIYYSTDNLVIDHFTVHNGQQHIIVDGKVTPHTTDSLSIDLNEVEVGYILNLVNFHAVEFSGEASGTATVKALFGNFMANADLTVDNFKFENGRMGVLYAKAIWNKEREQIDIDAVADDGPDAQTIIKGYVSPTHNTIDLGITAQGSYLDFMHNFTNTFLSSITGHANGALRLAGYLDDMNLTGQLVANGNATVTALNTTYTLRNDTVILIPDEIELHNMPVYDQYGNQAILKGGIHHKSLTSLTFDLFVETDNLLAYDFKDFGESTFYGTVFASGDVAIKGRPGEVTIDCNVTPQKNSVFVYNASSPDAISNQEFIQWGSATHSEASRTSGISRTTGYADTDTEIDIPTDIFINFLINCTPESTLRLLMDANTNDYITLNGNGTIRATFHNKGSFNMFGTYTVDHGTYGVTIQNIIKKNFTFNPGGTIIFGGDPYNAALNLQAVYTVNGVSLSDLNIGNSFASNTIRVNCLMNIGGQPREPQVDFDLEMPTVNADEQQMVRSIINGQQEMNQQVLYLLGIGRFYNQGQNNADAGQTDQTTLAMQSFLSGTLSTQINSLLNTVIKNDNWNFGANISTGDEGWHNAEYEGLISGRMLNNRLLLNGQFGYRDNATRATPSFIGDFDIQYLLYPNGNLALKVYNQTNDRYFTKSALNTQGIGLIMKKDFNGLRDLFSTKKKKKKTEMNKNR